MKRWLAAVRKEIRQFMRDRLLLALIAFVYTGDVVMCTYALSFDVRHLRTAIVDLDRTPLSARLVERFISTEYFSDSFRLDSAGAIDPLLDHGRIELALVIPSGFSGDVLSGRNASVQVLLSGMNGNTANAARGYAASIVGGYARDSMVAQAQRMGFTANLPEVSLEQRIWYNPELQFRYFMVISMLVIASLIVGIVTAAAGLVREKESGTIEQLVVTPLRSHELILAKAAPALLVGLLLLIPSFGIAAWFDVPFEGSVALFVAATAIAFVAFLSLGFLLGALAKNLQQALLLSFFTLFPLMFLSGTIVPLESMPSAMRWLSYASPVRYYMEAALGIFLKGNGITILWPQLAALAAMGIALGAAAVMRLRRDLYR